jgi:hypothetical protein
MVRGFGAAAKRRRQYPEEMEKEVPSICMDKKAEISSTCAGSESKKGLATAERRAFEIEESLGFLPRVRPL